MKALTEIGQRAAILLLVVLLTSGHANGKLDFDSLQRKNEREIRPLIQRDCQECHPSNQVEAEADLAAFTSLAEGQRNARQSPDATSMQCSPEVF